jgi:hypothetical protein
MGTLIGIVIVGFLIWAIYASYLRVLASKRYTTRQHEAPDLNRFAEGSSGSGPKTDDTAEPPEFRS